VTHDPATAAAYVAGELTGAPHIDFEQHLLACQECWEEVEAGRRGRELVEYARESAPDHLRAQVMADLSGTVRPPRIRKLALAVVAACVAALVGLVSFAVRTASPVPMNAAIAGFRSERLPGERIPTTQAPDLSKIGLNETAAGAGDLGGVPVTAYAYRDQMGRRLLLYVGERPFVTPRQAEHYGSGDADSSWITREEGISVLCSRTPHVTLVVGQDDKLVRTAADFLDLT
jgi:anti-sigma factor RsiW